MWLCVRIVSDMVFPVVAEVPSARVPVGHLQPAKTGQEGEIAEQRLAEIDFRAVEPGNRLEVGVGQR